MGNSIAAKKGETEESQLIDTEEKKRILNEYIKNQKTNAAKLCHIFWIIHLRKKIRDAIHKSSSESKILMNSMESSDTPTIYEKEIYDKFNSSFNNFNKTKIFSLEHEFKDIILEEHKKNLNSTKDYVREYYINKLEKYHFDLYEKLIKIKNSSNIFEFSEGVITKNLRINSNIDQSHQMKETNYINNSNRSKLINELEIAFNYSDPYSNSILLNFLIQDEAYPSDMKKLLKKFFYLRLLKISGYLNETKEFVLINKSKLNTLYTELNLDIFSKDQIVDENYNKFFELLEKVEKNEKFIESVNNLYEESGELNLSNSKQLQHYQQPSIYKDNFLTSINQMKKLPKSIFNRRDDIFEIKNNSSTDIYHKKLSFQIGNKFPNRRYGISARCLPAEDKNLNKFVYYNGEYDNISFLYSGTGTLIKNKLFLCYLYYGTFKNGEKNGIGKIYIVKSEDYLEFYLGEWDRNKKDGCGLMIVFDNHNTYDSRKIFSKGKFHKGVFSYGIQITIYAKKDHFIYENYEGDILNNCYDGMARLIRKVRKNEHHKSTAIDHKINHTEFEYDYEYHGYFKNNLENGRGISKKKFLSSNSNYTYEGEFVDGKMHGAGIIEYEGDNFNISSYDGMFENDEPFSIFGKVKFKSGDEFEGFFDENHKKTIIGLYYFTGESKQGESFFGNYDNDKKNGFGRFVSPIQSKLLIGKYIDGEKNGQFSLVSNNSFIQDNSKEEMKTNKNTFINKTIFKSKKYIKEIIKQMKIFYVFENDDIIEKSDIPFK